MEDVVGEGGAVERAFDLDDNRRVKKAPGPYNLLEHGGLSLLALELGLIGEQLVNKHHPPHCGLQGGREGAHVAAEGLLVWKFS